MSTAAKKDGVSYWIRIALWLVISFSGWFIPANGIITAYGMKVLGIFVGLMFGWICLDLIFPSFFSIILMSFAAGVSAQELFYKGFAYQICVIIFVLCTFIAYIQHCRLDETLAKWAINLKFLEGKPWLFVSVYMALVFVLGYLVGIYPCIFVMWPITYAICEELGYAKKSAFASFMLFAVTYISGVGMIAKPMEAWCLIGLTALQNFNGYEINYMIYSIYMLIIAVLTILAFIGIGKIIMKIDVEPLKNRKCTGEKLTLNKKQKIGVWMLVAFLLVMYAPSILPKTWGLTQIIKSLGVIGVGAVFCVLLGMWRMDGEKICDVGMLAKNGVPWSIVFLMCANCVVIDGMQAGETGIIAWIAKTCAPMFAGLSPILFYLALIVFYGIITQFVHNVVLLSVFVPITLNFTALMGANPVITTIIGIAVLSCALATAGASSRSGLVFGNTEWIDMKWAYFLGIANVVVFMLIMFAVGVPLGSVMFPM